MYNYVDYKTETNRSLFKSEPSKIDNVFFNCFLLSYADFNNTDIARSSHIAKCFVRMVFY